MAFLRHAVATPLISLSNEACLGYQPYIRKLMLLDYAKPELNPYSFVILALSALTPFFVLFLSCILRQLGTLDERWPLCCSLMLI